MQLVEVGGYTWLLFEQIVGVAINLFHRRGGQSHQQEIEVSEDGSLAVVDCATSFVDNDKVEMADIEA